VKTILKLSLFVLASICILISTPSFALAEDYENDSYLSNDNFSNVSPDNQFSTVPINPAFIEYQKELEENSEKQSNVDNRFSINTFETDFDNHFPPEISNDMQDIQSPEGIIHPSGLKPSPIDFSYISPVDMKELLTSDEYGDMPSSMSMSTLLEESYSTQYDLREKGGVTGVRDQAFAGTCWAHASLASLESYLMHNRSEEWDFSENHVKNALVSSYQDGFDRPTHDDGGNDLMTLAYLARWDGPVTESDDPYDDLSPVSSSDTVVAKHVQEALMLPMVNHSDDLFKWAITNYGAITVAMHDDSSRYFNKENNTYYCYEEGKPLTHAVCLAGWDDNFDRNRFTPAAPGDGAYIIKNSWGDNWGDAGYFYISYYDTALGTSNNMEGDGGQNVYTTNFVITAENVSNYDRIYQYDPLGWCSSLGYNSSTVTGANIFTAGSNETLEAVSFYTTDSNSFYNISIYLDPEDGPINASGPVSVKNGSMPLAGYHTVDLDTNVSLSEGQNFSVMITFTTPTYNYPLAIERAISGHSSNAHAEKGQSYLRVNETTWEDISQNGTNVCIKAFTKEDKEPESRFVADKRYVHVNEPVNFHDASLFSPESWEWDFGDNSTSTEQDPSHFYTSTGIYNVSLNASNEFGSNSKKRTSFIQVLNTTINVNSSGNADFTNIQDAIVAASEGDTIIVEPGTYTERLSFRKDNLTLRSSTGNPADVKIISSNPDDTDKLNFAVFIMGDNVTFQGVTVSGGYYGILLQLSNNCSINDCMLTNNYLSGLFIGGSYNNSILNCTTYNNTAGGLYLTDSANNYFANNSMFGNSVNCVLISQKDIIDISNTVEGKPIYYLSGVSDVVIDKDSNAGLVHLVDCSNITVKDIEVEKNYYGTYLYNTSNSTIKNSTYTKNFRGIYLDYSTNNTVSNCTSDSNRNYGIALIESSYNLIYNNYFNNTDNVLISGILSNQWNISMTSGTNIIGGDYIGGNYWAKPNGSGWSQVNPSTGDGFCEPYTLTACNIDNLPLTTNDEISSADGNNANDNSGSQSENDGVNIRKSNPVLYDANVVSVVSDMQFVGKDSEVNYEFTDKENPVTHIRLQAKTTEGYVVADVSRLDGPHKGLSEQPSGKVYQNLEITLGDESLSFSDFIDEAVIGFNVPREWVESNNIDESTIRLEHYSDGMWETLPTTRVDEADGILYFEAVTTGFSPFAICADTVSANDEIEVSLSGDDDINSKNEGSGSNSESKKIGMNSFLFMLFILFIIAVFAYVRYQKRDR
jgi:PGF-pre-PGF domain-containing protein